MTSGESSPSFDAWSLPREIGAVSPVATIPPARVGTTGVEPVALRHLVPDAATVTKLLDRMERAREAELVRRPALQVARAIGRVAARLLDPEDVLRRRALDLLPPTAGLSPAMAREVLDGMAADWTDDRLGLLLQRDIRPPGALDGFVDEGVGSRVRVLGEPLQVHFTAGTVPGVSVTSLIRALLVKSAVLLKPGRGDVALPVLFLDALRDAAPAVADAAAVLYWPGGVAPVEDLVLRRADLVVVYGGDDTVADVRGRVGAATRLVAYRHRVSVGVVGADAFGAAFEEVVRDAGRAVALFDQRGCVSPHVIYVEGGSVAAEGFGRSLAEVLERLDRELPPGTVDESEASALQQLRGTAELRAAAGEGVLLLSGGRAPWTVIVEPAGAFEPSCSNRFVRVVPVDDAFEVAPLLAPVGRHLQTVAVEGLGERLEGFAEALARVGALRITTFREQPFPPPWWKHDGAGPLQPLVRRIELRDPPGPS